ncbi:MAG: GGDEF domain-containing protein [Marinomonas sp.]
MSNAEHSFNTASNPQPHEDSLATSGVKARLWRNGLLVVAFSVAASIGMTHLAFSTAGEAQYGETMVIAALIPLLVAPLAFGWIANLTLQLERSRAEMDRLAHTDPLTGLANRRAAMQSLRSWSNHDAQDVDLLSIAIADIDFFKRINDTYGHDAGDAGIIHVASILTQLTPDDWLVSRIGGEEFLIAAPQGSTANFPDIIEQVRAALEASPLITQDGPHTITASFGIAAMRADEAMDPLMVRADRALYKAKETGRNRTVAAG